MYGTRLSQVPVERVGVLPQVLATRVEGDPVLQTLPGEGACQEGVGRATSQQVANAHSSKCSAAGGAWGSDERRRRNASARPNAVTNAAATYGTTLPSCW